MVNVRCKVYLEKLASYFHQWFFTMCVLKHRLPFVSPFGREVCLISVYSISFSLRNRVPLKLRPSSVLFVFLSFKLFLTSV